MPVYERWSLVRSKWPAAAVIPAPIAYIKVVAVKKLVVGLPGPVHWVGWLALTCRSLFLPDGPAYFRRPRVLFTELRVGTRDFYFEKIRVFKAGLCYEYISME